MVQMLGWFNAEADCASRSKSLQRELVLCQIFRKEFQRHKTPQLDIFGLIDNTHPAAAQLFHDAVMRNGLPN